MVGPRARSEGGSVVNAREEVLARIRAANASARPTTSAIPRDYRRTGAHPRGAPELMAGADRLSNS